MQEGGEDLEPKVLLITKAIGTALNDTDLVVDAFDQAEGHLVPWTAVGLDAVPMAFDHRGEALKGGEPLPEQLLFPPLEESSGPSRPPKAPELAEGLLEQVSPMDTLIGLQEHREAVTSGRCQMRGS